MEVLEQYGEPQTTSLEKYLGKLTFEIPTTNEIQITPDKELNLIIINEQNIQLPTLKDRENIDIAIITQHNEQLAKLPKKMAPWLSLLLDTNKLRWDTRATYQPKASILFVLIYVYLNVEKFRNNRNMSNDEKRSWYYLSDAVGKRTATTPAPTTSSSAPTLKNSGKDNQNSIPSPRNNTAPSSSNFTNTSSSFLLSEDSSNQQSKIPQSFSNQISNLNNENKEKKEENNDNNYNNNNNNNNNNSQERSLKRSGTELNFTEAIKRAKKSMENLPNFPTEIFTSPHSNAIADINNNNNNDSNSSQSSEDIYAKTLIDNLIRNTNIETEPSNSLNCSLRSYQKQALSWLIEREKISQNKRNDRLSSTVSSQNKNQLPPNWIECVTKCGKKYYYNQLTKTTTWEFPLNDFAHNFARSSEKANVRGGILADEMGMGKTIEILALILSNTPSLIDRAKNITTKNNENNNSNQNNINNNNINNNNVNLNNLNNNNININNINNINTKNDNNNNDNMEIENERITKPILISNNNNNNYLNFLIIIITRIHKHLFRYLLHHFLHLLI